MDELRWGRLPDLTTECCQHTGYVVREGVVVLDGTIAGHLAERADLSEHLIRGRGDVLNPVSGAPP